MVLSIYYIEMTAHKSKNKNKALAQQAGLIYVSDTIPGISRKKTKNGFHYFDTYGLRIKDEVTILRINNLGIAPAYTHVWICPIENGHIQATGIDAKGRKQYRYHPIWREYRQNVNYERMIKFGNALPHIRKKIDKDMLHKLPTRTKILAAIIRIMDMTLIRVGNEKYAKDNESYGLTTILKKHVLIEDQSKGLFKFDFIGKSGKHHNIEIKNKKLYHIVHTCLEIPGYPLFQFVDHCGIIHDITSDDVNDYLKDISGNDFSAKDFRTWWGTVFTLIALNKIGTVNSSKEIKKALSKAVTFTSSKLRNTPSVCRKFYIYPGIMESFSEGTLSHLISEFAKEQPIHGLSHEEWWTLKFLETKLESRC